jgi:Uma2 family endonuclease
MAGASMTVDAWAALAEDEPGEIVDDVLIEEEDAGFLHDAVGAWLVHLLMSWIGPRGGFVGLSHAKLHVRPRRGRKADVTVFFPGRRPEPHGLVKTPPDIAIEIVSPAPKDARRDRIDKLADYRAFRVRFYWILDPGLRTLEVYALTPEGKYEVALAAAAGAHAAPGCDGLTIDLDALWAEVDRLLAGQA